MCPHKAHGPLLVHVLDTQDPRVRCQKGSVMGGPTEPGRKVREISTCCGGPPLLVNVHMLWVLSLSLCSYSSLKKEAKHTRGSPV